jgi:hypothetical protein
VSGMPGKNILIRLLAREQKTSEAFGDDYLNYDRHECRRKHRASSSIISNLASI